MSKIPEIKPKKLKKIVLKLGFKIHSGKGSHVVFKHKDGRRTVISIYDKPIKIGTLRAILKQIKISVNDFLKLL